jgi:hypothetical protein
VIKRLLAVVDRGYRRLFPIYNGYIVCSPMDYYIYAPWLEPSFQEFLAPIRGRTVVSDDRCYILHQLVQQCSRVDGDMAECGCYLGGTAFLIAGTMQRSGADNRPLHLFDTFNGMPAGTITSRDGHSVGEFGDTSFGKVKAYCAEFPNIVFHQGTMPQTFDAVAAQRFSFVHVDVDTYPSTAACCEFFYPRLNPGGALVCDDYGFYRYRHAAMKAVDEFFADKPETPLSLRTGQCLVVKLP